MSSSGSSGEVVWFVGRLGRIILLVVTASLLAGGAIVTA